MVMISEAELELRARANVCFMGSSAWRKRRNFSHRGAVKKARARVYNDALHARTCL